MSESRTKILAITLTFLLAIERLLVRINKRVGGNMGTRAEVVIVVLIGACTSKGPSKQERCEQLRDHVIDLRIATIPAKLSTNTGSGSAFDAPPPLKPDIAGHRAALKQALGTKYIESCSATLSDEQLNCAIAAKDGEALANCQGHVAR